MPVRVLHDLQLAPVTFHTLVHLGNSDGPFYRELDAIPGVQGVEVNRYTVKYWRSIAFTAEAVEARVMELLTRWETDPKSHPE